jgi:hypothetical protein
MGIPLGIRSWFAIVAIRRRKKNGDFAEGVDLEAIVLVNVILQIGGERVVLGCSNE